MVTEMHETEAAEDRGEALVLPFLKQDKGVSKYFSI